MFSLHCSALLLSPRRLDLSSLGLEDWPPELVMNTKEGQVRRRRRVETTMSVTAEQYASLKRLNLLDNILTEMVRIESDRRCCVKKLSCDLGCLDYLVCLQSNVGVVKMCLLKFLFAACRSLRSHDPGGAHGGLQPDALNPLEDLRDGEMRAVGYNL